MKEVFLVMECDIQRTISSGSSGYLASRIKEKFNRPVIAFADDSDSRNGRSREAQEV